MIKYFSLFSGIGAFEKAFRNLEIPFELVGYSEIDKYASKSYSLIHGIPESKNYGDITKIDEKKLPKGIDLVTYGFPCQDISLAGKQKGLFDEDGNKTRSGLFFDALRIIEHTQPKVAIAENVKNLVGKKFKEQFEIVLSSLEQAGYNNYWQILNAKDYGLPQNRERVFIVSIRKDVDTGVFEFPNAFPLEKRLKDLLEDTVDEKFYIKKALNPIMKDNYIQWDNSGKGYASQQDRAYYQDGLAPTLSHCNNSGDKSQVILEDRASIIIGGMQKNQSVKTDGICTCLTSSMGQGGGYVPMINEPNKSEVQGCLVENKGSEFVRTTNIAATLLARDYKGLPNTAATAVLVREPINLVTVLNEAKTACEWTDEDLADELDIPLELVASWFTGASIPSVDIWEDLKWLLEIENNHDFDELIEQKILVREATKQGYAEAVEGDSINLEQPNSTTRRGRVGHQVSQTLTTAPQQAVVVSEPMIAASRGRNPENASDRTAGIPTEQRLEINKQGICNTLTTVQKDNYVIERVGRINSSQDGVVVSSEGIAPTHTAGHGDTPKVAHKLRIRKLTPKECFRLMGFEDEDHDVCKDGGISDTQLYKEAGNSIAVDVAEELACMLFDEDGELFL